MTGGLHIGTALAAGAVSALMNLVAWALFKRTIEGQDQRIREQDRRLQSLGDDRVSAIETALRLEKDGAVAGRRRMYETMVSHEVCASRRAAFEQRLIRGDEDFKDIRCDVKFVREETARQGVVLGLVAKKMNVRIEP